MEKIIIAAIAGNGIIGNKGTIPWHIKEELAFFKSSTMGFPIIMGRRTFESLKKPLPGRLNIVLTSHPEKIQKCENLLAFKSVDEAVDYCAMTVKAGRIFFIGGAEVYKQTLPAADFLYLSRLGIEPEGDTCFPEIDYSQWQEVQQLSHEEFTVFIYKRKTVI